MVKCWVYSKYVFQCLSLEEVTWAREDCGRIGYLLHRRQSKLRFSCFEYFTNCLFCSILQCPVLGLICLWALEKLLSLEKNAHVQWKESGERIDILNLMRHGMFRFHSRALPLQSTIVADSGEETRPWPPHLLIAWAHSCHASLTNYPEGRGRSLREEKSKRPLV